MRIVIDLQGAQTESRLRGIGRYSLALATAMVRNNRGHEILIALNGMFPETIEPIVGAFHGLLPPKSFHIWTAAAPVNSTNAANSWRRGAAEVMREEFIHSLQPDVVHVSSMMEGFADDAVHSIGKTDHRMRVAATFYDAIPLIQREVYLDPHPAALAAYLEKLEQLKRADLLLAISESARQEAIAHLNSGVDRVINIGSAVDSKFAPTSVSAAIKKDLGHRFGFRDGFIMYSGAADERKNHPRLIEAFSMLPASLRSAYPLLIVGGMPDNVRDRLVKHARSLALRESEVVFTGRVSDEQLVALCNLCSLFVLPSWHEGFGLPALEAMSCGAATIGSNTSSVPEVIGREDALFDPYNARAISQKMEEVLCDQDLRTDLARHGLVQAKSFSWDKSANATLDALERLVSSPDATHRNDDAPMAPEARIAAIVREIAQSSQGQDHCNGDLLRAAEAISFNVRPQGPPKLYIDISNIIHVDAKSGIQRVARSLLHELLAAPPEDHTLMPIYFDDARYRRVGIAAGDGDDDDRYIATGEVVELRPGDSYLALDLGARLSGQMHDLHLKMKQFGVGLYFVVHDILSIHGPDGREPGISPLFEKWLRSIAEVAAGLACTSKAVADDVSEWLQEQPLSRKDGRPLVGSFHLGADIESSHSSTGLPSDAQAPTAVPRITWCQGAQQLWRLIGIWQK